jgi:hypothetical protein
LFTAVDKEPDIGSPPESTKKKKTLESASRLGGRGFASLECPRYDNCVTAEADPSKGSETGSSEIGEVAGSTRDHLRAAGKGCNWNLPLGRASDAGASPRRNGFDTRGRRPPVLARGDRLTVGSLRA